MVYLVSGEYCSSENGIVAWQEGVFVFQTSATDAARSAAEGQDGRRCIVNGEVYGGNWDCGCQGLTHEDACSAEPSNWEVSFEVRAMEVQE
jgi:hypothetical protein